MVAFFIIGSLFIGFLIGVSVMEKYIVDKCDKKEEIYTHDRRFRVIETEAPK